MVLTPMDPNRFGSPIETTPATNEVKISGITSILISRTNKSPIHFELCAASPKIKPRMMPRTKAVITRAHSFNSVFEPRKKIPAKVASKTNQ